MTVRLVQKNIILGIYLFILWFVIAPTHAQVSPWSSDCYYVDPYSNQKIATLKGIECVVRNILNVVISLIGVAVLTMLVFGALKILTSNGDPKAVAAGQSTLTYAVIGLILALSAWFILNIVAGFTGAPGILEFRIGY